MWLLSSEKFKTNSNSIDFLRNLLMPTLCGALLWQDKIGWDIGHHIFDMFHSLKQIPLHFIVRLFLFFFFVVVHQSLNLVTNYRQSYLSPAQKQTLLLNSLPLWSSSFWYSSAMRFSYLDLLLVCISPSLVSVLSIVALHSIQGHAWRLELYHRIFS